MGSKPLQETGQNIEGLRRGKAAGDRVDDQDILRRSGGKRDAALPAEGDQEGLQAPLGELNARIGPARQVIGNEQAVLLFHGMIYSNVRAKFTW